MQPLGDILVVDDELPIASFLAELLSDTGYTVRIAQDGVQAIEQIWQHIPNLVLLDVMMPRLNGLATLQKLRSNGFTHLPIIVMSAGVSLEPFLAAGATAIIAKPLDIMQLLALIAAHMTQPNNAQMGAESQAC